jgi:glycosyltransferase involved in cell wall biosynthesis
MRVLITVRSQYGVPGGAGVPGGQIGMVQLARALVGLGVEVHLFVGGHRPGYLRGLEQVPTTYLRWPAALDRVLASGPPGVRAWGKRLRRRRWLDALNELADVGAWDVIHVQGLEDAEALLGELEKPLVSTHWGRLRRWQSDGVSPHDEGLRRRVARLGEHVTLVAIGEAQGEDMAAVGLPPATVIPPGIDLQHFSPGGRADARQQVALPLDDGVILYVGRLAPDKNVETLLRAFALPSQNPRRAKLLIVGDGPLRERLRALSVELAIEERTTFRPFVPHHDLPAYYRGADVTIVPSDRLETFCMVALEAIACGCPLIVTDQVPEITRRFPGVPAFTPHDAQELRRRIDEALYGHVRPVNNSLLADYDWSEVGRRYIALYEAVARPRPPT